MRLQHAHLEKTSPIFFSENAHASHRARQDNIETIRAQCLTSHDLTQSHGAADENKMGTVVQQLTVTLAMVCSEESSTSGDFALSWTTLSAAP